MFEDCIDGSVADAVDAACYAFGLVVKYLVDGIGVPEVDWDCTNLFCHSQTLGDVVNCVHCGCAAEDCRVCD